MQDLKQTALHLRKTNPQAKRVRFKSTFNFMWKYLTAIHVTDDSRSTDLQSCLSFHAVTSPPTFSNPKYGMLSSSWCCCGCIDADPGSTQCVLLDQDTASHNRPCSWPSMPHSRRRELELTPDTASRQCKNKVQNAAKRLEATISVYLPEPHPHPG